VAVAVFDMLLASVVPVSRASRRPEAAPTRRPTSASS
jgi:hypothetical protein